MPLSSEQKKPYTGNNNGNNNNSNNRNDDCRNHPLIREIFETLTDHETRLCTMEELSTTLNNIEETVTKVFKYIKWAAPSIVSAAIAAGVVNGKLGAFLNALITGQ